MLDDLLKICLDPYFKPKEVHEPDRENLFELIYSSGNTINSKEKVNQRREYTWDNLYITTECKDNFLAHRFKDDRQKEIRNRNNKSNLRSNKRSGRNGRSAAARDDSHLNKSETKDSFALYSAYTFTQNNKSQQKIERKSPSRPNKKVCKVNGSRTETVFPEISNIIPEKAPAKFVHKNFSNHNEYPAPNSHRRSRTFLKKKPKKVTEEEPKLEEQLTFMAKFNQDVRERNRLRSIKVHKKKLKRRAKKMKKLIYYSFYF